MEVRFTRTFGIYGGTSVPASVHQGGAAVNVERGGGGLSPVEAIRLAQSPLAEALPEIPVGSHGAKLSRKIVRVVGVDNQRGVTDNLAESATVRTEDGTTASHRFNRRHAETFVERGVNTGGGGMVERREFGIADETEGANVGGKGGLANGIVNGFGTGPILARENKLPGRASRAFELIEGANQPHMILSGMLESRDVEKERSADFPMTTCLLASCRVGRTESHVVQAVINDTDAVAGHVEVSKNVARRISTDRDNGVLPMSQAPGGNAAIEHAERVVLACDVKRRQVVDRGDHGAWPRVEQTAVTWDVQDIETPLADEPRKDSLMPQNVRDGMSKAFRDGDEFEGAVEFLEERQVAFEDKRREAVAVGGREQGAQQSKDVLADAGLPPLDDGGGDADVH